jgi:hypothetical protein
VCVYAADADADNDDDDDDGDDHDVTKYIFHSTSPKFNISYCIGLSRVKSSKRPS